MKKTPHPQTPIVIFWLMENNREQRQIKTDSEQPGPRCEPIGGIILPKNNLSRRSNQKEHPNGLIDLVDNCYFMSRHSKAILIDYSQKKIKEHT